MKPNSKRAGQNICADVIYNIISFLDSYQIVLKLLLLSKFYYKDIFARNLKFTAEWFERNYFYDEKCSIQDFEKLYKKYYSLNKKIPSFIGQKQPIRIDIVFSKHELSIFQDFLNEYRFCKFKVYIWSFDEIIGQKNLPKFPKITHVLLKNISKKKNQKIAIISQVASLFPNVEIFEQDLGYSKTIPLTLLAKKFKKLHTLIGYKKQKDMPWLSYGPEMLYNTKSIIYSKNEFTGVVPQKNWYIFSYKKRYYRLINRTENKIFLTKVFPKITKLYIKNERKFRPVEDKCPAFRITFSKKDDIGVIRFKTDFLLNVLNLFPNLCGLTLINRRKQHIDSVYGFEYTLYYLKISKLVLSNCFLDALQGAVSDGLLPETLTDLSLTTTNRIYLFNSKIAPNKNLKTLTINTCSDSFIFLGNLLNSFKSIKKLSVFGGLSSIYLSNFKVSNSIEEIVVGKRRLKSVNKVQKENERILIKLFKAKCVNLKRLKNVFTPP